jgi:hypothetical protein
MASLCSMPSLRAIRFLPLVFVVGIDGFAMFAPYLIAVLIIAYVLRKSRASSPPAVESADSLAVPA